MKCPFCGTENPEASRFCSHCGNKIPFPTEEAATQIGTAPLSPVQPPSASQTTLNPAPAFYGAAEPQAGFNAPAPQKSKKMIWIILMIVFLCLCLSVAGISGGYYLWSKGQLPFLSTLFGGSQQQIFVGMPNRNNEADLYVVKTGDDIEKAMQIDENRLPSTAGIYIWKDWTVMGSSEHVYGGFIPERNLLLYSFTEGSDINYKVFDLGKKTNFDIFDTSGTSVAYPLSNGLFIYENKNESWYCHFATFGESAKRLSKSDDCFLSGNASTIVTYDSNSDGEVSLSALRLDNANNEVSLIKDKKFFVNYSLSYDGSNLFYNTTDADNQSQFWMLNTSDGSEVFQSEKYDGIIYTYSFAAESNAFYFITENEDGDLDLNVLINGQLEKITSASALMAQFNTNGSALVYVVGAGTNGEDQTAYIYDVNTKKSQKITSGQSLSYFWIHGTQERLLIASTDDNVLTLSSAPTNGDALVELYQEEDVTISSLMLQPGSNNLYLLLYNTDYTLDVFYTPLDQNTGFYLLKDWSSFIPRDVTADGKYLIFSGQEDSNDSNSLYWLELAKNADPEVLDDELEGVSDAILLPNGKEVIYTAWTGSSSDDVEIRKATLADKPEPTVLYEETFLIDVSWKSLYQFKSNYWYNTPVVTNSVCPGAPKISLGDNTSGQFTSEQTNQCYKIPLEANSSIVLRFENDLDVTVNVYDPDGNYYASFYSYDSPVMSFTTSAAGKYYIDIQNANYASGSYAFTADIGTGNPVFDLAKPISSGQTIHDFVSYNDQIYLDSLNLYTYAKVYYFEATAGQTIQVDVKGYSYGSSMDPSFSVMNSSNTEIAFDDDNGDSYDSQAFVSISDTGRYYVIVYDHYGSYGDESNYWFDLSVK